MRKIFVLTLLAFATQSLTAQVLKTISEIQTSGNFSAYTANCDTSLLKGQFVKVKGVVMTDPNKWYQAPTNYSFWIQEKGQNGPKTGLQIRLQQGSAHGASTGVTGLQVGMEVELQGKVDYFSGETQIALDTTATITILSLGNAIAPATVLTVDSLNLGAVSSSSQSAQVSGEKWQGSYVELQNLTVVSVNSSATRGNFTVRDANNHQIVIWDANNDMRLSQNGWTKPTVGTTYTSIKGIVYHRNFLSSGGQNNFELHPWNLSDLTIGSAPPDIQSVTRNPACPNPSGPVTVTATVVHPANVTITSCVLKYAVGASNLTYLTVNMTETTPGTWQGIIPVQPDGSFVHYYVEATDANNLKDTYPTFTPSSYRVNSNGCTISDIQYVAPDIIKGNSKWYESGYQGLTVTGVKGVVTASANDLGYIYIQEGGKTAWAGIQVIGDATVNNLQLGDSVSINGEVFEYFGLTQIKNATATKLASNVPYSPVTLPISTFADTMSVQNEAYESMLIRFADANLAVVNPKVDTVNNSHKGDYRIGTDVFDPNRGIRVLAGRQTNNIFSSLNVAYVNDLMWQVTDGAMNVTPYVVNNQTILDEFQGILTYAWNNIKLLPRMSSDMVNVRQKTTFTASASFDQTFTVYPNPAYNQLYVRFTQNKTGKISILDITGKEIFSQSIQSNLIIFNVEELSSGVYFVKVQTNEGTSVAKWIKN